MLPNLHGPSARPAWEKRAKRMMSWLVPVWITEMKERKVQPLVELDSIESDAFVAKGKLVLF